MKHSDKLNEFDELLKSSFDGLEMEPSTRVWMDIEKDLDKDKKTNKILLFSRYSVAASLVLVALFGMYSLGIFEGVKEETKQANSNTKIEEKKNISRPMQPIEESARLADVVEIKRKNTTRNTKPVKRTVNEVKPKVNPASLTEKEELELLKKIDQEPQTNNEEPKNSSEIKKPVVVQPASPSPSIASSTKKEVSGTIDVLNYISSKISGNTESNVVAVNEEKMEDGSTRKKYEVDLGIVKFSRVRNSN